MKSKTALALAAVSTVAVAGLALPALAEETPTDPPSSSTAPEDRRELHGERREQMQTELAERLAEELGLEAAEVSAALEKVTEELRAEHDEQRLARLQEHLDQAVEEGRLTREQADGLLAAAQDGDLRAGLRGLHRELHGFGPRGGGPRGPGGPGSWDGSPEGGSTPDGTADPSGARSL